jgi:hypothetical protein
LGASGETADNQQGKYEEFKNFPPDISHEITDHDKEQI